MSISTSSTIHIESWFISVDIFNIICLAVVIILAASYLFIITVDKTCHTVPVMFIANVCLANLLLASNSFAMTIFTYHNDRYRIQSPDSLCNFRGYMTCVSGAGLYHSFVLEAIYRYMLIIHPSRLIWQLARTQLVLIIITWIYVFTFPLILLWRGDIIYNVDNQICVVPLRLSFAMIYVAFCIFLIPILILIFIYIILVRYVRTMNTRTVSVNIRIRAQRELKMFRRIVILVMILVTVSAPYTAFDIMSIFTPPPKYHFRIAWIAIHVSSACVVVAIFQFTEPLKASAKRIICCQINKSKIITTPILTETDI